jgi:hypothetical protein
LDDWLLVTSATFKIEKRKPENDVSDKLKANAEGDKLLVDFVKWTKLSTIRLGLMMVGFLNALKELSEWYLL